MATLPGGISTLVQPVMFTLLPAGQSIALIIGGITEAGRNNYVERL